MPMRYQLSTPEGLRARPARNPVTCFQGLRGCVSFEVLFRDVGPRHDLPRLLRDEAVSPFCCGIRERSCLRIGHLQAAAGPPDGGLSASAGVEVNEALEREIAAPKGRLQK